MSGIDERVVQAVGWALLHFIWQGALIAAIAAAALRALRHSAADVRYVVATIALCLMATLPVVTGVQTWRMLGSETAVAADTIARDATPLITTTAEPSAPAETSGAGSITVPADPAQPLSRWMPWFVAAWMGGVLLLAVRLVGGWISIQRLKTRHAVPAAAGLEAMVRRLTRSLHISREVRLLVSGGVNVPTVIGWLKPTVLLPMSALSGL